MAHQANQAWNEIQRAVHSVKAAEESGWLQPESGADETALKDHASLISASIKFGSVHQEGVKQVKLRMQSLARANFCRA